MQVPSIVMDVYCGSRLVRVRGAIGRLVRGHHVVIAGCSFARDMIEAFLLPVARLPFRREYRGYVDYITVRVEAGDPW